MDLLAFVFALATLIFVVALTLQQSKRLPKPPRRFAMAQRRRVVLHTRSGHSIDGILQGLYADGVCVVMARFIVPNERPVPLEGDQIVPWASIDWVQELPHDARAADDWG